MNARYDAWVKRVEFIGLDQLMKPSVDCHSTLFKVSPHKFIRAYYHYKV